MLKNFFESAFSVELITFFLIKLVLVKLLNSVSLDLKRSDFFNPKNKQILNTSLKLFFWNLVIFSWSFYFFKL